MHFKYLEGFISSNKNRFIKEKRERMCGHGQQCVDCGVCVVRVWGEVEAGIRAIKGDEKKIA